ncbi:MAG: acetylglutamate kinase [Gemmatimonadaceae bacterium]
MKAGSRVEGRASGGSKPAVRVVKVGGRAQSDPALAGALAAAWVSMPRSLVVVHGGGDEVSALQRAFGVTPSFVGGRRVTSTEDIELLRMALSGSANKRLVSALVSRGVSAVGLSGEDAALLAAAPLDPGALGCVGDPRRANVLLLRHLLDGGYLPVVSPLSRGEGADAAAALNVNGDDAAAVIAAALEAHELLLVADVAGVLIDGCVVPELAPVGAGQLIASGGATGGMIAKLEAALAALEGGVARVRIGDVAAIHDSTRGTVVSRDAVLSRSVA